MNKWRTMTDADLKAAWRKFQEKANTDPNTEATEEELALAREVIRRQR